MKEIMQEIVLCGLSRAGFFQKAAFYGGTALRIFYGLDRFSRGTAVNQKHLRERLLQSGFITSDEECTLPELKQMLYDRFDSIDFVQAKQDVEPFIHDTSVLNVWSAEFFKQITEGLRAY